MGAVATPVHAVAEVPVAVAHAAPVATAAYAAAPVAHAAYAAAPVAHAAYAAAPVLLPDTPSLLPQPLLLKQYPKLSSVPKSEPEIGLYRLCAVSEFLRHTKLYNRKVGVSWWLFLVSLRTTSNVSLALQYDVTTI